LDEAREHAYANVGRISFAGMRYRTDIGVVMPWEAPPVSTG
jgi:phosphoribosylamine-glycine ligase